MHSFAKKAVFLDKDGTLIENEPFNIQQERVRFAADAFPMLRELQKSNFDLYVVTNQPGVALGLFPMSGLLAHLHYIRSHMEQNGVHVNDVFFCPHHPDAPFDAWRTPCACRKPQPGLLLDAAQRYRLNLKQSWMIGDILDDIEAGRRAGCRTILIDNGNETVWHMNAARTPNVICKSLSEAASYILEAHDA